MPESIVTTAVVAAGVPLTEPTEQSPAVPVIDGMTDALVVAFTLNVPRYGAVDGAPEKVTVGVNKFTVRLAVPYARPDDAVMVVAPVATPVARPVVLIVATAGLDDTQLTELVMSPPVPFVKVPVAVN